MSHSRPHAAPESDNSGNGPQLPSYLRKLLDAYNYCLRRRPLLTKCCTSAITATAGDIIGQMLNKQASYDMRRTIAFALFGFLGTGPITHHFYRILSIVIKPTAENSKLRKLLLERLLFAPAFLLLFFYAIPILQGLGLSAANAKVADSYWLALKANWKVWTLFQYININYCPPQYQSLFANFLALFWNIYLSLKQS